jgi:hypothetical protein
MLKNIDTSKVRSISLHLINMAHDEVLKFLTQSQDPMVKLIALRKFKYGYGLPTSVLNYSREFKILGELYATKTKDSDKFKVSYERDRKILTRHQEAEINGLVVEAIKWVHSYWSSVLMARLLVRVGDEETIISARKSLAFFPKRRIDPDLANLLEVLFEE